MKPTRRNHLASTSILLVMTALVPSTVSSAPVDLSGGAKFDAAENTSFFPSTSSGGTRNNLELSSQTGGFLIGSWVSETIRGTYDGGVTLWGQPLRSVLGTGDGNGGSFEVWDDYDFIYSSSATPLFKVNSANNTATFNGLNVTVTGGTLSVAGNLNLTGGTGTGLNFGGASIFTLDASGNVNYANTRTVAIASTTAANSTATAGALTVAGGIGVAKNSFINGLAIGKGIGSNTTYNTALGVDVLQANTTGSSNTGLGHSTLKVNTTGNNNTATGTYALYANTTGNGNVATGSASLQSNIGGGYNSAFGNQALFLNQSGSWNTGLGGSALLANVSGSYNTAVGVDSVRSNNSGISNVGVGFGSLYSNYSGSNNVALGAASGSGNYGGSNNIFIGISSGSYQPNGTTALATTQNSIYIGGHARGKDNNDSNSIVIGYTAIGEGANTVVMGNANTQTSHFFGQTTLTNTPWKNRPGGVTALQDPSTTTTTDMDGNALVVEGHTTLKGKVTISERQGDIPMFTGF